MYMERAFTLSFLSLSYKMDIRKMIFAICLKYHNINRYIRMLYVAIACIGNQVVVAVVVQNNTQFNFQTHSDLVIRSATMHVILVKCYNVVDRQQKSPF